MLRKPIFILMAVSSLISATRCSTIEESESPQLKTTSKGDSIFKELKLGVNTANLFLYNAEPGFSSTQISSSLKEIGMSTLRFPGGTTANFYHIDRPGYGYKYEDIENLNQGSLKTHMEGVMRANDRWIEQNDSVNVIFPFAELAVEANAQVLFVANLFSGTISESLKALKILHESGVKVIGVELGNEYYLNAYSKRFFTVKDYLVKAEEFSAGIKAIYPDLKISIVAAPVSTIKKLSFREQSWNRELKNHHFYDAISIHYYPRKKDLKPEDYSSCTAEEAIDLAVKQFDKSMRLYERTFGRSADFWISEWNLFGAPKWCNNNFAHALFIWEQLLKELEHPQVSLSIYHNLLSRNTGYNIFRVGGREQEMLEPLLSLHALELFLILQKHVEGGNFQLENELIDKLAIQKIILQDSHIRALIIKNLTDQNQLIPDDLMIEYESDLLSIYELNAQGLYSLAKDSSRKELAQETVRVLLFK